MLSEKQRVLLVLNGTGLLMMVIFAGWFYFILLLEGFRLFPFVEYIPMEVPGDRRAWNMAHMQAITNGLMLWGTAAIAPYLKLSHRLASVLFWTSITYAWLFTLPAIANALFDTRGLAFGGGPFEGGLINDLIYLSGWPSLVSVHIAFPILVYGAFSKYKSLDKQ